MGHPRTRPRAPSPVLMRVLIAGNHPRPSGHTSPPRRSRNSLPFRLKARHMPEDSRYRLLEPGSSGVLQCATHKTHGLLPGDRLDHEIVNVSLVVPVMDHNLAAMAVGAD